MGWFSVLINRLVKELKEYGPRMQHVLKMKDVIKTNYPPLQMEIFNAKSQQTGFILESSTWRLEQFARSAVTQAMKKLGKHQLYVKLKSGRKLGLA